jgi:hypothetical protein
VRSKTHRPHGSERLSQRDTAGQQGTRNAQTRPKKLISLPYAGPYEGGEKRWSPNRRKEGEELELNEILKGGRIRKNEKMVTSNLFKKNRSRRNYEKEHTECSESVDDQNVNREHHANVKPKKGTSGKFDSQLIATAEDSIQIIPLSVRNVASDQPTLSRSSPRSTVGEDKRTLLSKSDNEHKAYPDRVGVERNERTPTYTGVDYSELEEDSSIREAESCPKISGGFDASHDAQNTLIDSSERVRESSTKRSQRTV